MKNANQLNTDPLILVNCAMHVAKLSTSALVAQRSNEIKVQGIKQKQKILPLIFPSMVDFTFKISVIPESRAGLILSWTALIPFCKRSHARVNASVKDLNISLYA